jgi:hypothetical protein
MVLFSRASASYVWLSLLIQAICIFLSEINGSQFKYKFQDADGSSYKIKTFLKQI